MELVKVFMGAIEPSSRDFTLMAQNQALRAGEMECIRVNAQPAICENADEYAISATIEIGQYPGEDSNLRPSL